MANSCSTYIDYSKCNIFNLKFVQVCFFLEQTVLAEWKWSTSIKGEFLVLWYQSLCKHKIFIERRNRISITKKNCIAWIIFNSFQFWLNWQAVIQMSKVRQCDGNMIDRNSFNIEYQFAENNFLAQSLEHSDKSVAG